MKKKTSGKELTDFINGIKIIDTHEHFGGFDDGMGADDRPYKNLITILFNDYLSYLYTDNKVHPLDKIKEKSKTDIKGAFRDVEEFLKLHATTSTYRHYLTAFRDLYGLKGDELNAKNVTALSEKITKTYATKGERGWYKEILNKLNIVAIIKNVQIPYLRNYLPSLPDDLRIKEEKLFLSEVRIDPFLGVLKDFLFSNYTFNKMKQEMKSDVSSFQGFKQMLDDAFDIIIKNKVVCLKITTAYVRTLLFEKTDESRAKTIYEKSLTAEVTDAENKAFQDFVVWEFMKFAEEQNLPVHVHTGYSTPPSLADPTLLLNLVASFPDVKFLLLHSGWPANVGGLQIMARSRPNVYIDFSWMPLLSPFMAKNLLNEYLDLIPMNKIMLGIDTASIESCYGATFQTRLAISEALAGRVEHGDFSVNTAKEFAEYLFYRTANEVFKIF